MTKIAARAFSDIREAFSDSAMRKANILSKIENLTWSSKGNISLFRKRYVISLVICNFKLNHFVLQFLFFDFALKIMLLFGEIWQKKKKINK